MFLISTNVSFSQEDDTDNDVNFSKDNFSKSKELKNDSIVIKKSEKKQIYNIGVVLPIKNLKTNGYFSDGYAFWEGINFALPKIKKLDSKFKIHIWDNNKNDSVTNNIVNEMSKFEFDAVICPFHTKEAKIVSKYCKTKGIPTFLPLNPSDAATKVNNNLVKMNVANERLFYDIYLKLTEDNNNQTFVVYDSSSKYEQKIIKYLKYASSVDGTNKLKFINYSDSININNIIVYGKIHNFLMVLSNDNHFNNFVKQIGTLNEAINLYCQSRIVNNDKIDTKLLKNYNCYAYTNYYLNTQLNECENLQKKYYETTGDNVMAEVFIGYDLINYITYLLDLNGTGFLDNINKNYYNGISTNFEIKPMYDNNEKILFFENIYLNILKLNENGGWSKTN